MARQQALKSGYHRELWLESTATSALYDGMSFRALQLLREGNASTASL
jgi:hypothetical protein